MSQAVFYYDGKPGADGIYLVIMADGRELPGWYFMWGGEPVGPFDSEDSARAHRRFTRSMSGR